MDEHMIDVNKATVEDLETLKGIGRSRAEAIISTRECLGVFHSIEEILQVPGIGKNFLDQNKDILQCSLPHTPSTPQTNSLRRSLRRGHIPKPKFPKTKEKSARKMISSGDRDNSLGSGNRTGRSGNSSGDSSSSVNNNQGSDCVEEVRQAKVSDSDKCKDDDDDEDDDNEEEEEEEVVDNHNDDGDMLEFDFEDGNVPCSEVRQDIVIVIQSNKSSLNNTLCDTSGDGSDKQNLSSSNFGSESNVVSGLGSDTPHEEGMSDLHLDVPFSPMRLTDGDEIEMENEEENDLEEGDLEDKNLFEEEMMVLSEVANQFPDKKQNKRKSEVCTDSKGVCPVKKTCKAIDTSESSERIKTSLHFCHKLSPPSGLKSWLSKYQSWTPAQKLYALDSLINVCDLGQVRHIHQTILPQFQRDFISLLPKELALYVLTFLEPKDLLRAAQTCKYWNILAADNLLWREKCREAGLEDHMVVLNQRRKKGTCVSHMSPFKAAYMRQHRIEMNWRINPLRPPRVLKGHDDHVITCLQFSGNTVVSGSDDNTLKVWNATSGKCMRTLTGHTGGVWSSQMSDNLIVSGSTDRMLRVWNAESGECIHTLYGHTSTVRCLHLHGKKVVSGSRDATLRVWDVTTGACEHVLVGHVAAVRCVQYNGKLVVSGAYDFMVKVWNPDREECLHTLQGHTNRVYSLQFDGIHVVSGSLDTSIRVWDVETGQCRHTLMGHQSLTSGMELKNNILISGNADSTVKVWDILTGQCLQTLSGPNKHRSAVTCLQFNNKFVVTSSDDGTVKLWDVKTGDFIRNLVALESGGSGGVVWRIRASDTKLVCAVGSRNGTEETKLLVLDFDVYESPTK